MKDKLLKGTAAALAGVGLLTGCTAAASIGAEAVYPKMAQYPGENGDYEAWNASRRKQLAAPEGYADGLWDFYADSTRTYLSGKKENCAYSPLNLYMALSMLAECCGGESRAQILELMNAPDIESLRTQAGQVWNANYCDDGALTSILADSVWLDDSVSFEKNVVDTLAKSYYASTYTGKFGSDNMNSAIQSWLNKQTGGLLGDAVNNVAPDDTTLMALYSTAYFKGRWDSEFNPELNDTRKFHAPDGNIDAEFMNQSYERDYFWGEDFGAVRQSFVSGCDMWLILPDEDKSIDDVLTSGEYVGLIRPGSSEYENERYIRVNLALPKFDVSSTTDLKSGLEALGVTDVFDPGNADFSELSSSDEMYVGTARQSARVTIDEEGCTAAAFTEILMCGSACPPEDIQEIDFVLDRPFIFVITGMDGQPLFTGTVYTV